VKTAALRKALRRYYVGNANGGGWAMFDEVRNETGWSVGKATRTCDMLGMGLWRSRGMELHGFELKVSRGDWTRELRQPDKAGAIAQYVDHWWLVISAPEIASPPELPAGWGLMCYRPNGYAPLDLTLGSFDIVVKAPKREAVPLDKLFLAAVVRKLARGEFSATGDFSEAPREV
jgi:hypothetical protein